jgi:hypothetical protein
MAYHVPVPRRVRPRRRHAEPAPYPIYPLPSGDHLLPPGVELVPLQSVDAPKRDSGRKILFAILVVVALFALLYWLNRLSEES